MDIFQNHFLFYIFIMLQDLEKYFHVNMDGKKLDEKLVFYQEKILSQLYMEKDFFKFIALYGIFCLVKLSSVCPFIELDEDMKEFFNYFIKFLKKEKPYTQNEDYLESIREKFPIILLMQS